MRCQQAGKIALIIGTLAGILAAQACALEIRTPRFAMDYHKFSLTLSGDPKQDTPRIRGILARNLSACYVRAYTLANGIESVREQLQEGCELEAWNMARIPLHMHYVKRGLELDGEELEEKREEFLQQSAQAIRDKAQAIAQSELGL